VPPPLPAGSWPTGGLEPILVSKLACALEGPDLIERTRHPGDPADPRSTNHTRSDPMPAPATLTGQDVGEAEGALTALLNHVLSNTDITRTQYITLRVLALRGPAPSPAELHDYLAGQPQLALDRSQVAELLHGLEAKGLVAGSAADGPGPTQLTAEGAALHARLAEAVGAVTRRVYAGLDPDDLATTHRVLVEVTERARRLRDQP
jgi:DNA-binding MarR family transcriptional regulator